jgi:hypothetical protein
VFRSIGAVVLAAAMALLGSDAFRQALNEFRDTEPGSLLFGLLQLVIGASGLVAAVGLLKRERWASPAIGTWGTAAAVLLVLQPWFTPMESDAQWSIWIGAALVGGAAAGAAWCARRLARPVASSHSIEEPALAANRSPALLPDAQPSAAPFSAPVKEPSRRSGPHA